MKMRLLAIFAIFIISASAEMARFDNYHVFSLKIENEEQYKVMKYLEEHSDSYNFWKYPEMEAQVEIVVPPHKFSEFGELIEKFQFESKLIIENLQRLMDNEKSKNRKSKALGEIDWENYHDLETIFAWLDVLVDTYPNILNLTTIGHSSEGRPIKMITLSKKPGNRILLLEGTIHAREWISPATITYILNELLTSQNPDIIDLADNIDWHIIPVVNPDGYVYSWTSNRSWRKTRGYASMVCTGIDGNRNYGYNWLMADENGRVGGSRIPCTDTYAGSHPFSEPETRATENFMLANAHRIDAFIGLHSPGHLFLHPYGHTVVPPAAIEELSAVGNAAAEAIFRVNGIQYVVGSSNLVHNGATGTTRDHAHGAHKIPISFTIEMRGNGDYGSYGFVLPPEHILPNCIEIVEGFIALIHKAREFGRFPIN